MRNTGSLRIALLAALVAAPASAQPTTYDRAIAAGYKALTLCSGLFDSRDRGAKRTQASIEANELNGIYPEYDPIIATLPSTIDNHDETVTVAYDPAQLPRIAIRHARDAGCVILPIGSRPGAFAFPDIILHSPDREGPPRGWPRDDRAGPRIATSRALSSVVATGFADRYGAANTTGVLVVQNGKLVAERYATGFGPLIPQRTWSVAKSLSGTMIGTAVASGLLDVAKPAPVPEWQVPGDPRQAITLDNLMRMASGLHSATAGNRSDAVYFGGVAVIEETVAWPLDAEPGTRFRYANNDILLAIHAGRSVKNTDGEPAVSPETLFAELGMWHTTAETDWRGNYILSSQVWSTARDLARFGQLYLQDGVWNGKRLLPAGWVKYVTTPSGPQPEGEFGYGATFWLMNRSPGVPADTFAAIGNRGQYVVIVPSRQVVIVRRGEDPAGTKFDIAKFTAAILAALPC